jgi:hypothetical protein
MRKEIIFALLAGIAFGLVIAFGVWRANSNQKAPEQNQENKTQQSQVAPTPKTAGGLTILKPEEYEVFNENTVSIEGITESEAQVVISTEEKDFLTKANKDGGFNVDVPLVSGLNEIIITSFFGDDKSSSVKLPIVYSQDFQK